MTKVKKSMAGLTSAESFRLVLVCILLVILVSCSSSSAAPSLKEQLRQLQENYNHFKDNVEARNVEMEAKVTQLEVQIHENNEIIDRLESKIVQLEAKVQQQDLLLSVLHPQNSTDDDQQQEYSFYEINPSTNQSSSIYIGMPSSCKDLKLIGHTLNGLYSVMGNQSVETVFCDFTNLIDDPGLEQWIGYNDVKSSPVYFYVQKNSSFFAYDTPIPFEVERINVGNAMELPSGIFTAPQTGTYHFSFTGMASFPTSWTFVYLGVGLYVNGNRIGMGLVEETNTVIGQNSQLTLQSTLNLQVGDKVWVEIYYKSNSVFLYDASDYHYTHYTGWLM